MEQTVYKGDVGLGSMLCVFGIVIIIVAIVIVALIIYNYSIGNVTLTIALIIGIIFTIVGFIGLGMVIYGGYRFGYGVYENR